MKVRPEELFLDQEAADYYSQKAREYRQKAKDTLDKMLKPALETAALEFERRALEAKQSMSVRKASTR
jgi:hypothetical protein